MRSDRPAKATIAAAVVPPSRPAPRAQSARPSQQDTVAVAAVPVAPPRGRPSQQSTIAVPIVPPGADDGELALAKTMMPRAHTEIATGDPKAGRAQPKTRTTIATPVPRVAVGANDSSLEIPIDAVLVDEAPRPRRQITVGTGVLERVPLRRMWIVHAAVIVATLSIAVVALAAT